MEERLLALLKLALRYKASDIHFDLFYEEINIEMRIDGSFKKVKSKFEDYKLIRYLQYLANLDIGNITKPQSGQFEMMVDDKLISFRFSLIYCFNRVNGVLRILNHDLNLSVDNLSLFKIQNDYFKKLLRNESGLVLFSGPTGSGKTTTLYTLLKSVKNKKIYSIEDPIEVYQDNIIQIQVNAAMGFDYDLGVKQILRHDPDIIMIGEIRDSKAANIAIVAANTGHLVFSTIHTSKASSCISRMLEFGVDKNHLYENLLCLSHQRMHVNKFNHKKIVFYEVMDNFEIDYYKKHEENSHNFVSIDSQINKGIEYGYFSNAFI